MHNLRLARRRSLKRCMLLQPASPSEGEKINRPALDTAEALPSARLTLGAGYGHTTDYRQLPGKEPGQKPKYVLSDSIL